MRPNSSTALYVTENGIERMFTDLRDYIYPVYVKCQPLMYALTKIAFILIPLIAIGLIAFLHIRKKHRFGRKLLKKKKLTNDFEPKFSALEIGFKNEKNKKDIMQAIIESEIPFNEISIKQKSLEEIFVLMSSKKGGKK